MAAKRGDRVAPPAGSGEWELRFATSEAAKGWDALCQQAAASTATAWGELRRRPQQLAPTIRHHRLKGRLASAAHRGVDMEQWQYEVTAGGRLWYCIEDKAKTIWLTDAHVGHPKATE